VSARVKRRFGWTGLSEDVAAFVSSCATCAVMRLSRPGKDRHFPEYVPHAPMQPIEAKQRFEYVSIDVTTITPTTKEGYCKLLVMVDRLSRFVAAVPTKAETAESCAEAFIVRWIATFGPPVKLLSDRGQNFLKEVMRWKCLLMGVAC